MSIASSSVVLVSSRQSALSSRSGMDHLPDELIVKILTFISQSGYRTGELFFCSRTWKNRANEICQQLFLVEQPQLHHFIEAISPQHWHGVYRTFWENRGQLGARQLLDEHIIVTPLPDGKMIVEEEDEYVANERRMWDPRFPDKDPWDLPFPYNKIGNRKVFIISEQRVFYGKGSTIYLRDLSNLKAEKERFIGHSDRVIDCIECGDQIISSSIDRSCRTWNVHTRKTGQIFEHPCAVNSLTLLTEETFVSGASDGQIRLWHIPSGQCIHSLQAHPSYVCSLKTPQDGQLITVSLEKLLIWNTRNWTIINQLDFSCLNWKTLFFVNESLYISCGDGHISLIELDKEQALQSFVRKQARSVVSIEVHSEEKASEPAAEVSEVTFLEELIEESFPTKKANVSSCGRCCTIM